MCTDVLILAGGSGERLWPVSDAKKPKQFMSLPDGETFLQAAIIRAAALDISGNICIVTRKDWTGLVIEDVLALSKRLGKPEILEKVLVMSEPCGKNTAPAIAWTAQYLLSLPRSESVNILMMASDHVIKPLDSFVRDAHTACWHADRGNLVSFAIPPTEPSTGYGYIKAAESVQCPIDGASSAFRIETFKEKPDAETAQAYLADGHYFWNSGIYAFRADFFLFELERLCPQVFSAFSGSGADVRLETVQGVRVMTSYSGLEEAYAQTPSISIDYAISEKCSRSITVRADFLWDDVGTWDSLAKYYHGLPDKAVSADSRNCFVNSDIPVALCGVDDLVVVIKNGKALISRKGATNLVKDALALLKAKDLA
jgi:mannose-1-phosphate guanylyltransferase/mannose-6-phosphate isomerase